MPIREIRLTAKLISLTLLSATFSSCAPSSIATKPMGVPSAPAPQHCPHFAFAEPDPRPRLPVVDLVTEGCNFYACLDEKNGEKMAKKVQMLIDDDNYMRDFYTKQIKAYDTAQPGARPSTAPEAMPPKIALPTSSVTLPAPYPTKPPVAPATTPEFSRSRPSANENQIRDLEYTSTSTFSLPAARRTLSCVHC
jgi:hypothetical protein